MPYVSLIVEALRTRPTAVFWAVALLQAVVWVLTPALIYASPPGELPAVIAVGREFAPGSWLGPPLAPWIAAPVFSATGIVGIYVLAQLCVIGAYWAMFALGRRLVGAQRAVLAVMLMAAVLAFTVPTPEFGPSVLALPFAALALLCFWRAVGEGRRGAWIDFAAALALLLLTSYWALLFVVLLLYFMLLSPEGRAALRRPDPWLACGAALLISFPHAQWLWRTGALGRLLAQYTPAALPGLIARWPLLLAAIAAAHAGLLMLVVVGSGWGAGGRSQGAEIDGPATSAFGCRYVLFFAFALPIVGALAAALAARAITLPMAGPLVLLSGLAVMAAVKMPIALHRQHVLGRLWFTVLLGLPLIVAVGVVLAPWTGFLDPSTRQPAAAMANFFTDTYRHRTGRPLAIVAGESRAVFLIAAASSDRPRLYLPAQPERTPWLSEQDVRRQGAIVVWPVEDPTGRPPPAIRARFPDLAAEVPETFESPIQGLLAPLRLGWGLIRPQSPAVEDGNRQP
jgi:4-amino-4-deoxy-L-arabinose transferase-like glycosyltransferase